MGTLNMRYQKRNKLDKSKSSSCSPVFKYDCTLETWSCGGKSNTWALVFFKKFQDNSDMYLDFKKWLQIFLLDPSLGNMVSGSAYVHRFSSTQPVCVFWLVRLIHLHLRLYYDPVTVFLIVWGLFSVGLFFHLCFLFREVPLAFFG